jgi:hypothetical protein
MPMMLMQMMQQQQQQQQQQQMQQAFIQNKMELQMRGMEERLCKVAAAGVDNNLDKSSSSSSSDSNT